LQNKNILRGKKMITSRHISSATPNATTAACAHERLRSDTVMRRNKSGYLPSFWPPAPPITTTLATAGPGNPKPIAYDGLSPIEQERRARQVARSFKQHYLSKIHYLSERRIAVAVVKPIRTGKTSSGTAHRICVDTDGNVSIDLTASYAPGRLKFVPARQLFTIGILLAALGTVLLLVIN
jgi:hypothetical protein